LTFSAVLFQPALKRLRQKASDAILRMAQSTHAIHSSMQSAESTQGIGIEDDLSHLANARLVRRVNDTSPIITTPALTNEESSQFSSSGSGPLSMPGNTPLNEPPAFPRPILALPRHNTAHPSGPTHAGFHPSDALPPANYPDLARPQDIIYGNQGNTSGNDWSLGIPLETDLYAEPRNHEMLHPLSSWFDDVPDPRLHGNTTERFHDRLTDTHPYTTFASQVSPPSRTGLVLPFDQLDAYGIFVGRHDLMSDTVRDEEMPLLPGTNIEQFLATLDSNAL
jgi:hypothetical protein